ncbi:MULTISPECIES: flagellar assembly protein FliH [Cytobacillus]|uniref:Flagellar assembly protein FliH n=1 Tax=Cytobacillus stercorigallinarum TaxID=2762240 RepID=A0ABR8QMI0_9BACI|nr:flagellar assembly protein FliH [Cytobacillus stercorigallinarum]MBD7936725.1 flagellar assembly protein FliH [Cytobacillus stercorigallinarum]
MSRLFKHSSHDYLSEEEKITISIRPMFKQSEDHPSPQLSDYYDQVISEAEKKAEEIIHSANEQADRIYQTVQEEKEKAKEEQEAARKDAYEKGYLAGMSKGKEDGLNTYTSRLAEAKEMINAAKTDYEETIQSADRAILMISMKVAEKIIATELTHHIEHYQSYVKNALKEAKHYKNIKLIVHPDKYIELLSYKDELKAMLPVEAGLYILPDEELSVVDCVIDSDNGRIDATCKSQIDEIKEKLSEWLETHHELG